MLSVIQIHPDDTVCVATRPLAAGTEVMCGAVRFTLDAACPLGAKLALVAMRTGDKVIKFGEPIGSLTADVAVGGYIHTHNLESDYLHTYERGELIGE
ncbi:UxaA family hydrolase [Bacteroidota bacterium]